MPVEIAAPETIHVAELESVRAELASRFHKAAAAGIAVDYVVDAGSPVARVLDRAQNLPADLVVMGTHGASGFEHLVLGSVTEKVLRRSRSPVLTVPPRVPRASELPFKHVLCAVDFSESSLAAVRYAGSLAEESGATLTLLHVLEWPWEEPPPPALEELPPEQAAALGEFRRYSEATARAQLESLVPARGSAVAVRVENGKPYVQVLRVANEGRADLVVIGVRGRHSLDMTLFGSTANHVVRLATCPVLTLCG
jgi:nucleotide-binding universal stress UspA family protein